MAGILPGVECARRRRLHQGGGANSSDNGGGGRRPTLCLYTSNHDNGSSHSSMTTTTTLQRSTQNQNLGGVARQAKERLDEKLRLQRSLFVSKSKRQDTSSGTLRIVDARTMEPLGELQTEVLKAKSWKWGMMKLRWKTANSSGNGEQEECPICIDGFKVEEQVVHLPCVHKFHTKCLLPWLLTNAHCPCCRMVIHIEIPSSS